MTASAIPEIADTEGLAAWEATIPKGTARSFLDMVSKEAFSTGAQVMITRAEMVLGIDHLRSALYHAKRSMALGTNASDSLPMETLLYASGERQLSAAIRKMSADEETTEVIVALLDGRFQPHEGWSRLRLLDREEVVRRLSKFGISRKEIETIGGRRPEDLILEIVAAVDVLKK